MSLLEQLDKNIAASGGLIVSCQPVPGSPLDKPEIVAAMALAAEQAGAVAVRIEGIDNLRVARSLVSVPIIGIIKRDLDDSPVRITPFLDDVDALAQAGAAIIAVDGTARQRPVAVEALLARASSPPSTGDGRLLIRGRWSRLPTVGRGHYRHDNVRLHHPRYAGGTRSALSQSVA